MTAGPAPGSYNLVVANGGQEGLGLTAENIAVTLNLEPGTTVADAVADGFMGVADGSRAVWRVPRLGPGEEQTYAFTISNGGITGGEVVWHRQGRSDRDRAGVALP